MCKDNCCCVCGSNAAVKRNGKKYCIAHDPKKNHKKTVGGGK